MEVALCFGWIDGRANGVDAEWWLVRYTPRRAKSIWSQKNIAIIGRLVEAGRMRPPGLAAVEAAKTDGRWERAYAGPTTITVPDDFATILAENDDAAAFFAGLNKSDRYLVLWRVETASVKARTLRIKAMIGLLAVGKFPGLTTKSVNAKKNADKQKPVIQRAGKRKRREVSNEVEDTLIVQTTPSKQPRREGLRRRHQDD